MIGYAVYENGKTSDAFDKYTVRGLDIEYYESAWKDVKEHRSNRDKFYVIGGVLLAAGIGVHIWF